MKAARRTSRSAGAIKKAPLSPSLSSVSLSWRTSGGARSRPGNRSLRCRRLRHPGRDPRQNHLQSLLPGAIRKPWPSHCRRWSGLRCKHNPEKVRPHPTWRGFAEFRTWLEEASILLPAQYSDRRQVENYSPLLVRHGAKMRPVLVNFSKFSHNEVKDIEFCKLCYVSDLQGNFGGAGQNRTGE